MRKKFPLSLVLTRAVSLTANHESPAHKPALLVLLRTKFFIIIPPGYFVPLLLPHSNIKTFSSVGNRWL